jgi:hypothetical protein
MIRLLTVEFRVEPKSSSGTRPFIRDVVNLYVDGVLLQDLVRPVEQPFAEAEGKSNLAGNYVGLEADAAIRWPGRHFLSKPGSQGALGLEEGRDPYLLGCTCGGFPSVGRSWPGSRSRRAP